MDLICRTCLDVIARDSPYFSLNANESDSSAVAIKEKLEACVPELRVHLVKNSILCNGCVEALCAAYKFKKKCLETEAKIYDYIQKTDADHNSIDLENVIRWSSKLNFCKQSDDINQKSRKKAKLLKKLSVRSLKKVKSVSCSYLFSNSSSEMSVIDTNVSDNSDSHETIHEDVTKSDTLVSCSLNTALNVIGNTDSDQISCEEVINNNTTVSCSHETTHKAVGKSDTTVGCTLEAIDKIITNIHTSADFNKQIFSGIIQDTLDDYSSDQNNCNCEDSIAAESGLEKSSNTNSVLRNKTAENSLRKSPNEANTGVALQIKQNAVDNEKDIAECCIKQSTLAEDNKYSTLISLLNEPVVSESYAEACNRKKNEGKGKHLSRILRKPSKSGLRNTSRNSSKLDNATASSSEQASSDTAKQRSSKTPLNKIRNEITINGKITKTKSAINNLTEHQELGDISMCLLKPSSTVMNGENIAEEIPNLQDNGIKPVIINWSGIKNENSMSDLFYTDPNNFGFENISVKIEKCELDEQKNILFTDDENDIKPVISKEPDSVHIISGMSCDLEGFCAFEQQFLGYTMDEFYSNQLVALPECSVNITRLSNAELEEWTRKELPNNQKAAKTRAVKGVKFYCSECPFSNWSKKIFLFHTRKHLKNGKKIYQAERCRRRRIYRCTLCNYSAKYESSLLHHLKQLHGKGCVQTDNELIHSCDLCQFSTTCKDNLVIHKEIHVAEIGYKCSECKFHTSDKKDFKNHARFHALYAYKCIKCTYSTVHRRNLKKHYTSCHFMFKPYVCSVCDQHCTNRKLLIQHVFNTHIQDKVDIYIEHNYAACYRDHA